MSRKQNKQSAKAPRFDTDQPLNARELLQFGKSDNRVKMVNSLHNLAGVEVQLVDFQLKSRGAKQDQLFADNKVASYAHTSVLQKVIFENFRRGLSVAIIYDKETAKESFSLCRRGLKKFFDLYWEFLYPDITHTWVSTSHLQAQFRSLTLSAVDQVLRRGKEIEVFVLEKANGENSQVSYLKQLDAWVISSKNAALVTRGELDPDPRYAFARQVGEAWFHHLQGLSQEEVSEIKQFLETHTLVGELCGGALAKHFIQYSQSQLLFFAIVAHDSLDPCLSPQKSLQFFEKSKLEHVKFEAFTAANAEEFQSKMSKVYRQVAEGSLEQQGEGCVLYLVDKAQQQCLSLAKIKTMEYRILKKLKEKMIFQLQTSATKDKLIESFQEEAEQVCQFFRPKSKDLGSFFDLARIAFKSIEQYMAKQKEGSLRKEIYQVSVHFPMLLERLKKISESPEMDLFGELPEQVDSDEEDEGEGKQQQKQQQEESKNQGKQQKELKEKNCILILPVTIPATGKTVFLHSLKQSVAGDKSEIFVLTSDEIRKRVVDYHLAGNKNCSREDAVKKTQKKYTEMYNKELEYLRDQAYQSKFQNVVIFLDKNHASNAVKGPVQIFRARFSNLRVVGLLPQIQKPLRDFPFSLTYLISCIQRAIKRKNHETLNGDENLVASIVIFFFKLFKRQDLNELFDEIIEVPFTNESEEVEGDLKNRIMKDMKELLKVRGGPEEIQECREALQSVVQFAKDNDLGFPEKQLQEKAIAESIGRLLEKIAK